MAPTPENVFNFNRFTYANNNPIVNSDPTGKNCMRSMFEACGDQHLAPNRFAGPWSNFWDRVALSDSGTGDQTHESNTLSFSHKLSRNFHWLLGAFHFDIGAGVALQAKVKIGPLKLSAGAGAWVPFNFGGTLNHVSLYSKVQGPSANIQFGNLTAGWIGKTTYSYMAGSPTGAFERTVNGGFFMGARSVRVDSNSNIGVHVGVPVLGSASASVNVGQVLISVLYWGNSTEKP